MARPVRIDVEGGVYHVISRGIDRQAIFRTDADRLHFLDRLAEAQRRFRLCVYAYVLMDNHFHLVVRTPDANLSRAVQWLKVSYSMWFNAKYKRVGPLFQGRFKGVLVDADGSWLLELSLYVHLNPVRVKRLGLGKREKGAEALGWTAPSPEAARERLAVLRSYRWSSYAFYAGYRRAVPEWLDAAEVSCMAGTAAEYRRMAEYRISHGIPEDFLSAAKHRTALGSAEFVERIRKEFSEEREHAGKRALRRRYGWNDVVHAVEQVKGIAWSEFSCERGDWGRAAAYYLARRYAGMTLSEIGMAAGMVDYAAVSAMEKRFEKRLAGDDGLRAIITNLESILNVET